MKKVRLNYNFGVMWWKLYVLIRGSQRNQMLVTLRDITVTLTVIESTNFAIWVMISEFPFGCKKVIEQKMMSKVDFFSLYISMWKQKISICSTVKLTQLTNISVILWFAAQSWKVLVAKKNVTKAKQNKKKNQKKTSQMLNNSSYCVITVTGPTYTIRTDHMEEWTDTATQVCWNTK